MRFSEDIFAAFTAALPSSASLVHGLRDDEVEQWLRSLSEIGRAVAASTALLAGEVAHRSRPELGYSGLAQKTGHRTPTAFVQSITRSTGRDASALVHVGLLQSDPQPWQSPITAAVASGDLSVDGALAITRTLDPERLSDTQLDGAVLELLDSAGSLNDDELLRRARELRDELDEAGIAERERRIHEDRAIRRVKRANGLPRYIVDPDIESAALWDDVYYKATSPRRAAPQFADVLDAPAEPTVDDADQRTPVQLAHDSITELMRVGAAADTSILGPVQPAVRALVTATQLANRNGHGYLEGQPIPVSIETIERLACSNGTVAVLFSDNGKVLDLGKTSRLHSGPQRVVIGARDGGCIRDGCDRPVVMTEVHHVKHWVRDRGDTTVDDGVLLCRHDHLLVHNNGWEIVRENDRYLMVPPRDIDPHQTPRPTTQSPALRELMREQAREVSARETLTESALAG